MSYLLHDNDLCRGNFLAFHQNLVPITKYCTSKFMLLGNSKFFIMALQKNRFFIFYKFLRILCSFFGKNERFHQLFNPCIFQQYNISHFLSLFLCDMLRFCEGTFM